MEMVGPPPPGGRISDEISVRQVGVHSTFVQRMNGIWPVPIYPGLLAFRLSYRQWEQERSFVNASMLFYSQVSYKHARASTINNKQNCDFNVILEVRFFLSFSSFQYVCICYRRCNSIEQRNFNRLKHEKLNNCNVIVNITILQVVREQGWNSRQRCNFFVSQI